MFDQTIVSFFFADDTFLFYTVCICSGFYVG